MKYTVIYWPDVDVLIVSVNSYISEGWKPLGGVVTDGKTWAQALTWDDPKGWIDLATPITQEINPATWLPNEKEQKAKEFQEKEQRLKEFMARKTPPLQTSQGERLQGQ